MLKFQLPIGEPLALRQEVLSVLQNYSGKSVLDIAGYGNGKVNSIDNNENQEMMSEYRIGLVRIIGGITRYENACSAYLGGVSLDRISSYIYEMNDSPEIDGILLEIDSPGGQAAGIADLADYIAGMNKPVVSFVSDVGASAAYWLAAAADKIVVSQSSVVGSIGVYAALNTPTENENEIVFVSSVSPNKHKGPDTDEGKASIQNQVDSLGEMFVNKIASFRSTTPNDVMENYGKGDVVIASDAVTIGMADKVGNIQDAVNLLLSYISNTAKSSKGETIVTNDELSVASAQLVADALAAERKRAQSVYALATPTNMAIAGDFINAAIFDGKTEAGDVAIAILNAQEARRAKIVTDAKEDAGVITVIDASIDANKNEDDEQAQIDALAQQIAGVK